MSVDKHNHSHHQHHEKQPLLGHNGKYRLVATRQGLAVRLTVPVQAGEHLGIVCEPVGCCCPHWHCTRDLGLWLQHSDDNNCYVYRSGRYYVLALRRDLPAETILTINERNLPPSARRHRRTPGCLP